MVVSLSEPEDDWLLVARQSDPTATGFVPVEYVKKIKDLFDNTSVGASWLPKNSDRVFTLTSAETSTLMEKVMTLVTPSEEVLAVPTPSEKVSMLPTPSQKVMTPLTTPPEKVMIAFCVIFSQQRNN